MCNAGQQYGDEPGPTRGRVRKVVPTPAGALEVWERKLNPDSSSWGELDFNLGLLEDGAWYVSICVMEFISAWELKEEFCRTLRAAMGSVLNVSEVSHYDRENWMIVGCQNGQELAESIAHAIDQYEDVLLSHIAARRAAASDRGNGQT
jgi:hypothetical protein